VPDVQGRADHRTADRKGKLMKVDLTAPEIRALLRALGETLDATDEDEQRTIFGSQAAANAGRRAQAKLRPLAFRDEQA
jgi:CBS-domain-containing membrane protein